MNASEQRRRLACEAARLMAREAIPDPGAARRKAARALGISDRACQPDDEEIRRELRAYLELFHPAQSAAGLRGMREAALEAMRFFRRFEPRLVGGVFDGTAQASSAVVLHLHVDEAEAVPRFLEESGIPAQSRFRRLHLRDESRGDCPAWTFLAGDQAIELQVLPLSALRHAPLDGAGKPLPRASLATLSAMLATPAEITPGAASAATDENRRGRKTPRDAGRFRDD
jgi:hypothetical protein